MYGEPRLYVLRAWRVLRATLSLAVSAGAFGRCCGRPQYLHLQAPPYRKLAPWQASLTPSAYGRRDWL